MYNIRVTQKALDDIKKLTPAVKEHIHSKIKFYADNPLLYARKLTNFKLGSYRFRIGEYRVIFDFQDNCIDILRVCHRKDVYR